MALFESTSAYNTEGYTSIDTMISESYEISMSCLEGSYRLESAIYLADAMLENHRAEGVSEADLSVLMEETKKSFKQKIKDFFAMIWKKITDFFKKIRDGIKWIFSKKYRAECKATKAKIKNGENVNVVDTSAETEALNKVESDYEKRLAAVEKKVDELINRAKNGEDLSSDEINSEIAKAATESEADTVSKVQSTTVRTMTDAVNEYRKSKGRKELPSTQSEKLAAADSNEKTVETAEKNIQTATTKAEATGQNIKKKGDSAVDSTEDPKAQKAIQQTVTNGMNCCQQLLAANNAAHAKVAAQASHGGNFAEHNTLGAEGQAERRKARAAQFKPVNASFIAWDPSLEAYVIEGSDDTPDLEDLDDDLDDTDEACGKKSLKEGATLLDKALGML